MQWYVFQLKGNPKKRRKKNEENIEIKPILSISYFIFFAISWMPMNTIDT